MKKRRKSAEKLKRQIEKSKASIRAKVEHPFRTIKCQFGFTKAQYKGLLKNGSKLNLLFALANLFQVRKRLMA